MTTLAATGFSRHVDPYRAGAEAARKALVQVEDPDQILLFSSVVHDPYQVSKGVRSVTKGASIMGGSSFGEITNDGMHHHSVALMAIRSDSIDFRMAVGRGGPDTSNNAGDLAAHAALGLCGEQDLSGSTLGLFLSEMAGNEKTLHSLQRVLGQEHRLFGGCCSGNRYASIRDDDFTRGYQFIDDQVHNHSVPLLHLFGDCRAHFGVAHGWQPYGGVERVGRCDDNVIYQIGDMSAAKFYERFLGSSGYTPYPLAFEEKGKLVLRAVTGTADEGGLRFTTGIPTGTEVRITRGNRNDILVSSREAAQDALIQLGKRKPLFGIIVSCISRHMMLGSRVSREFEAVQEVLGRHMPLIGFYAAGEYAPVNNRSLYHNLTFCICLVSADQEKSVSSMTPQIATGQNVDNSHRVLLISTDNELNKKCSDFLHSPRYRLFTQNGRGTLADDVRRTMPQVVLLESVSPEDLKLIHETNPTVQVILLGHNLAQASLLDEVESLQNDHENLFGACIIRESPFELKAMVTSAAKMSRRIDHFQTTQSELHETKLRLKHAEDSIEATERMLTESYKTVEGSNEELEAKVEELNTAYQRLEQVHTELRHKQKLEAVGRLAAGIAHEINTPIQFVGDSAYFLRDSFDDLNNLVSEYRKVSKILGEIDSHKYLQKQLEEAEEEADLEFVQENIPQAFDRVFEGTSRVAKIVQAMKEFAHPGQEKKSLADINKGILNTVTVCTNEYRYAAVLKTDLGDIPMLMCHIGDLNQVFLNMIVNSAHAITDIVGNTGEKGEILISTRRENDSIEIKIKDTGNGIPEEIMNKIFDPFFTTKEVGRGSGQGMTIVHNIIVKKHSGTITCDSEEGKGTTFTIQLPVETTEVETENFGN